MDEIAQKVFEGACVGISDMVKLADTDISEMKLTPIERAYALATETLITLNYDGLFMVKQQNVPAEHVVRLLTEPTFAETQAIWASQVWSGQFRVDFFVAYRRFGRILGLVVECDGHDFHEKTKEQAARDKARDRELVAQGFHVLRFTGAELYRDPVRCAWDVIGLVLHETPCVAVPQEVRA